MEHDMGWILISLILGIVSFYGVLKIANEWFFVRKLDSKQCRLPPGDLGLPFIGNMWHFVKSCKSGNPDSFISSLAKRYGDGGMYKVYMFGKPTVIVATAETCKHVLMSEQNFQLTFPKSVTDLIGRRVSEGLSLQQLKILRKITVGSVAGNDASSYYLDAITDIAVGTLDRLASRNEPIELLTEMRKYALQVMMSIILGDEPFDQEWSDLVNQKFSDLCDGIFVLPIDLPGFAYHKAAKARDKLVEIFHAVIDKRRVKNASGFKAEKNILDQLMESEDDEGRKFSDEKIVCIIILYAFGGMISTALTATFALINLQQHPECLNKAKEEQEYIVNKRSSSEAGLTRSEVKEMNYLSKVIDETLRLVNPSSPLHRVALTDVHMNGYTIPKGWRALTWTRNVHMDERNYSKPNDFNPSRWDDHVTKPGVFAPFGLGPKMCPGADLARLELSILLHYFLLSYRVQQLNPKSRVRYFPTIKHADNCLATIKKLSA